MERQHDSRNHTHTNSRDRRKRIYQIDINFNDFNLDIIDIPKAKQNIDLAKTRINQLKAGNFERGSGHASLYAQALYIWDDNKILCIGYKNFYNKIVEKKLIRSSTHPHNYYLDVLVSTGLIGLIILIVYLIILFSKVFYLLIINIKNISQKKFDILIITFINT